jgi:hypothetical protein
MKRISVSKWSEAKTWTTNVAARLMFAGLVTIAAMVHAGEDARSPELPLPLCEDIQPPAGHRVSFRAYAIGVQIYVWSGTEWVFKAPEAVLYAEPNLQGEIGIHYAGPRWEANDGSVVAGSSPVRCFPDETAIPWLRLNATPLSSHGLFSGVTYIQRVNTTGGLAPAFAGSAIGEEARISYTAEYYFYRAN